jgi:hypothetical protein
VAPQRVSECIHSQGSQVAASVADQMMQGITCMLSMHTGVAVVVNDMSQRADVMTAEQRDVQQHASVSCSIGFHAGSSLDMFVCRCTVALSIHLQI